MTAPEPITLDEIRLIEGVLHDGTYTKLEISDFTKLCTAARRGVEADSEVKHEREGYETAQAYEIGRAHV